MDERHSPNCCYNQCQDELLTVAIVMNKAIGQRGKRFKIAITRKKFILISKQAIKSMSAPKAALIFLRAMADIIPAITQLRMNGRAKFGQVVGCDKHL
jgi:hypothetical protein